MKFNWIYNKKPELTILEQIKNNRQINAEILDTHLMTIPDPSLLKDLDKAAERIITAVKNKEKIIIFGHDDLDGITSTYILFDFLETIGSQNHYYYIPNRLIENHGMQKGFLERVRRDKYDLVITVDNGISDFKPIDKITASNCDVIVTDHHLVRDRLPSAYAVINPKRSDCSFPFKMLAGVGVVYLLVLKLAEILGITTDNNYLFWVAVGSIADKVPMININRYFVKKVLDEWSSFNDPTIKLLAGVSQQNRSHTSRLGIIRFIIRLLSNNQEENGENRSLNLLLSNIIDKDIIYRQLLSDYQDVEKTIDDLKKFLAGKVIQENCTSFVYYDVEDKIPLEYLGFGASYITNHFKIPAVILKEKNTSVVCEARCSEGFNLIDAFNYCSDTLIQYGGHVKAAGFSAHPSSIQAFLDKFNLYVEMHKENILKNKKIHIDAVIPITKAAEFIDFLFTDFDFMQPYGEGNPSPFYLIEDYIPDKHQEILKIDNLDLLPRNKDTYDLVLKFNGAVIKIVDYQQKVVN
ncbi:MAG: DHH family phosphoesterase [Candidatus Cloacimonetes bacterium]|nr:DHH family phosphoesterase [Candidatus Cloacimonadota bacterium]